MNEVENSIIEALRSYVRVLSEADGPTGLEDDWGEIREQALISLSIFYRDDSGPNEYPFREIDEVAIGKRGQLFAKVTTFDRGVTRARGANRGAHPTIVHDERPGIDKQYIIINDDGTIEISTVEKSIDLTDLTDENASEYTDDLCAYYDTISEFKAKDEYVYNLWSDAYYGQSYEVEGLPDNQPHVKGIYPPTGLTNLFRDGAAMGPHHFFMIWLHRIFDKFGSTQRLHGFGPMFDLYKPYDASESQIQQNWRAENNNRPLDIKDWIKYVQNNFNEIQTDERTDDQRLADWEKENGPLTDKNFKQYEKYLETIAINNEQLVLDKFELLNIDNSHLNRTSPSEISQYHETKHYMFGKPIKKPLIAADLIDIVEDGVPCVEVLSIDPTWDTFYQMMYRNLLNKMPNTELEANQVQFNKIYDEWVNNLNNRYKQLIQYRLARLKGSHNIAVRDISLPDDPYDKFIHKKNYLRLVARVGMVDPEKYREEKAIKQHGGQQQKQSMPSGDEIRALLRRSQATTAASKNLAPGDRIIAVAFEDNDYEWITITSKADFVQHTSGHKTGKKRPHYVMQISRPDETGKRNTEEIVMQLESGIGYDVSRELLFSIKPESKSGKVADSTQSIEAFDKLLMTSQPDDYFRIERIRTKKQTAKSIDDYYEYYIYFKIKELGITKKEIDRIINKENQTKQYLINQWIKILNQLKSDNNFSPAIILNNHELNNKAAINILDKTLAIYLESVDTSVIGRTDHRPIQPPEAAWQQAEYDWFKRFPSKDMAGSVGATTVIEVVTTLYKENQFDLNKIKSIMQNDAVKISRLRPLYGGKRLDGNEKLKILDTMWRTLLIRFVQLANNPKINMANAEQHVEGIIRAKLHMPDFDFDALGKIDDLRLKERAVKLLRSITTIDIAEYLNRQEPDEFSNAINSLQIEGAINTIKIDGAVVVGEDAKLAYSNILNLYIEHRLQELHKSGKSIFVTDNHTFEWDIDAKAVGLNNRLIKLMDDPNLDHNISSLTEYGHAVAISIANQFISNKGRPPQLGISVLNNFYQSKYASPLESITDEDAAIIGYDLSMFKFKLNIKRAINAYELQYKFTPDRSEVYSALNKYLITKHSQSLTEKSGKYIEYIRSNDERKLTPGEHISLSNADLKVVANILDELTDIKLVKIINRYGNIEYFSQGLELGLNTDKLAEIIEKIDINLLNQTTRTNIDEFELFVETIHKRTLDKYLGMINNKIIDHKLNSKQVSKLIGLEINSDGYKSFIAKIRREDADIRRRETEQAAELAHEMTGQAGQDVAAWANISQDVASEPESDEPEQISEPEPEAPDVEDEEDQEEPEDMLDMFTQTFMDTGDYTEEEARAAALLALQKHNKQK